MLIISVIFQPILFFRISLIRNNGAAEIECIHILIQYYFRRIDILQSFKSILRSKRFHQCSNLGRNVVEASFYSFQLGGLNKRFVTLNVDYDIKVSPYFSICFIATIRTTFMINGSHHYFTSESFYSFFDPFIICGHISIVQNTCHLFIYSLYYSFTSQHGQRFCRKTRGCVTGGNDS